MPYLAFDLDAFENCAAVGNGCGLQAAQVSHGLLTLWRHCWIRKSDLVTTGHLKGFFFGADVCEMLLTFGHIEASSNGWRVKGASKYLNIETARSANGKKAVANGNLKRGTKPPAGPQQTPSTGSNSAPALSSSIQHPTSTKAKAFAGKPAPVVEKAPDPRHAPLVFELTEIFRENGFGKYPFQGRDAKAVSGLLAIEPVPERISTVWRHALRSTGYPLVRTIPELLTNYAHFTGPPKPSKGPVDPATQTHTQGEISL